MIRAFAGAIALFGASVCFQYGYAKIEVNSTRAIVQQADKQRTLEEWLESEVDERNEKTAILYKKVSKRFLTQERTRNETKWLVGSTVEHHAWDPTNGECGEGKFHACSQAYFCDEFRNEPGDRYVAIEVALEDLHFWGENRGYPHKIAFRKCVVLHECDRRGRKIEQPAELKEAANA